MRRFTIFLTVILICTSSSLGQSHRRPSSRTKQAMKAPKAIIQQLTKENDFGLCDKGYSEKFVYQPIQLAGNRTSEFLVHLEDTCNCTAVGNCPQWLFRNIGETYEMILRIDGQGFEKLKAMTNGYR